MYLQNKNFKHYIDLVVEKGKTDKLQTVKNVNIVNIRLNDIAELVYEELDPKNNLRNPQVRFTFDSLPEDIKKSCAVSMFIYRYCIYRILTKFNVWHKDSWQYHLMDDYWSQEVSAVTLIPSVGEAVDKALNTMSRLNDSKKIEFILKLEHGRVLPELVNCEWTVSSVKHSDFYFSNPDLYNEYKNKGVQSHLDNYKLPRALCFKEANLNLNLNLYRVIDGYSRIADNEARERDSCLVIYALPNK